MIVTFTPWMKGMSLTQMTSFCTLNRWISYRLLVMLGFLRFA